MSKCVIQTRVMKDGSLTPPAFLEPGLHRTLYEIPQITAARQFMLDNNQVDLVAINIDDKRCYTITRVQDGTYEHHAIELDPTSASVAEEKDECAGD